MTDFLLELRSEEVPARMQAGARADLEKLFRKEMDAAGVAAGEVTVWSTPRRLALVARDLPEATAAVSEELKGPKVGAPPQALEGFLRKTGLTKDQLTERDGVLYAVTEKPGRPMAQVLAIHIPLLVARFPWPKSMRWGQASISTESIRWVRPLSGVVAILGNDPLKIDFDMGNVYADGHGNIEVRRSESGIVSSNVTYGHRFHHPGQITIGSASDYQEKLRACHVIVDHAERQDLIRTRAKAAAEAAGLTLVEDEGLVIENAGLTEWPVPLLGRFDEEYLEVPPEVIQLTARTNQKYFVCEQNGKLASAFVCTANIEASDGGAGIIAGNRKVLAARLSDARFFWQQDRKKTLAEHAEGLARITFHEKLGTVADKVERVAKLARWLVEEGIVKPSPLQGRGLGEGNAASPIAVPGSEGLPLSPTLSPEGEREKLAQLAEQAARLCKADLVTEMVGEFPELQGLMGGYYARAEGLPDAVADAIAHHYKPVGQGDDVPTAPVTVAVSLADKLDTLFGFFAIEEKPTGSKDPFALRRAALGTIRILQTHQLRLSIVSLAFEAYASFEFDRGRRWFLYHVEDSREGGREFYPVDRKLLSILPTTEFWAFDAAADEDWFQVPFNEKQLEAYSRARFSSLEKVEGDLLDFFADRLKVQQREAGVRHDLIDAVFALGGEDDLVRLLARVHALQAFVGTEVGKNLLAGYKRAANILKKEDWNQTLVTPAQAGAHLPAAVQGEAPEMGSRLRGNDDSPSGLSYTPEPAEKALIDALAEAGPRAAAAVEGEDFAAAMAALASLRAPIDAFFDEVTVNDADPAKRSARLGLLGSFRDAVHAVADFAKIEG